MESGCASATVQVSLKMETVMWDRGLLATPDIIGHTLKAMLVSSNPHGCCVFASSKVGY